MGPRGLGTGQASKERAKVAVVLPPFLPRLGRDGLDLLTLFNVQEETLIIAHANVRLLVPNDRGTPF
jgi:hypothetical protein